MDGRCRWREGASNVSRPSAVGRQRQSGQGAPAAVADQAEIRQQDFLGRPDHPDRQRRVGVDGLADLRIRWRSRRRLGTGSGRLLGRREDLARGQALFRRPRSRESPRCRADGPDLRQPGGPERQPRSGGRGQGHPRDLRAHGDERRGDGRVDRRRPLVRQDPWSRRREAGGARPRSGQHRAAGPWLEEQLRYRQGR